MNQKRLVILACCTIVVRSLSVRNNHHEETKVYEEMFAFQFWNLADTIGILVILGAIGFACWKLRGCFSSNNEEQRSTVIIVPPRGQEQERSRQPPSPRNNRQPQPEPKQVNYDQYKMKPSSQSNKTNQPMPSTSANPYVTEESQYKKWSNGNDFNNVSRQNQPCSLCQQFSKEGERPRIVVSCGQQHVFHVSCLNDHRSKILTFMGGNGLYKCPKCKQLYSANIYLYCNVCRKMRINVNLSECSDKQGQLKMGELRNIYGDCCHNCRVV